LKGVNVKVSAGVVRLEGVVPAQADIARAEALASRVAGVVTVENRVTRNLAVDTNLSPALKSFGDDVQGLVQTLPLVGVAIVIGLIVGGLGYLLASAQRFWIWVTPNPFMAELAGTFVRFVSIVIGLVVALQVLGATALLGGVLGGAGVIGIAVGFAVRDTVDNYVSSMMLSLRQPFRANDHVIIEGQEGRVVRLTSRATILITLDGNHLRIPNSIVFKSIILNFTRNTQRRFEFDLGVDADDDALDAIAVALAAVNALDFVLDSPKATAFVQQVGDSNVVLRIYGWLDQGVTDFYKGRGLAIDAAFKALTTKGFTLPEPIYRLRFDDAAPLPLKQLETAKTERPSPRAPALPKAADSSPDAHVEDLVREERASGDGMDMLDSKRPVE